MLPRPGIKLGTATEVNQQASPAQAWLNRFLEGRGFLAADVSNLQNAAAQIPNVFSENVSIYLQRVEESFIEPVVNSSQLVKALQSLASLLQVCDTDERPLTCLNVRSYSHDGGLTFLVEATDLFSDFYRQINLLLKQTYQQISDGDLKDILNFSKMLLVQANSSKCLGVFLAKTIDSFKEGGFSEEKEGNNEARYYLKIANALVAAKEYCCSPATLEGAFRSASTEESYLILKEIALSQISSTKRKEFIPHVVLLLGKTFLDNFELELLDMVFSQYSDSDLLTKNLVAAAKLIRAYRKASIPESFGKFVTDSLRLVDVGKEDFSSALDYYRSSFLNAELDYDADALVYDYLFSDPEDEETHHLSQRLRDRPFFTDHSPFLEESLEDMRAHAQSCSIMRQGISSSASFTPLMFSARRCSELEGGLSTLAHFSRSVFRTTEFLFVRDKDAFPGAGLKFSYPEVARILQAKTTKEGRLAGDPFSAYKAAWPFLSQAIDDFDKSEIIFLRGMQIFMNHESSYTFQGHKYCLVVFNNHFHAHENQRAFLVPWEIIEEKLSPCLQVVGSQARDINFQGLTLEYLYSESKRRGLGIMDLTSASNLGGLCNSLPANQEPLFGWEGKLKGGHSEDPYRFKLDSFRDSKGHLHKTFIDGSWHGNTFPEDLLHLILPFQEAHNEIYKLAEDYFNIQKMFFLSFSHYQKGWCAQKRLLGEDKVKDSNANVLRQALAWHHSEKKREEGKRDFPVMMIADPFNLSSMPSSVVTIDTENMNLSWEGRDRNGVPKRFNYPLSKDSLEPHSDDVTIWNQQVMPLLLRVDTCPMFFPRFYLDE